MQCKLCRREMAPGDPIYRFWGGDSWYPINGSCTAEVCAECCATKPSADWPWIKPLGGWRLPKPCERCGRPVINAMRRKLPKHIVCSRECRLAVYGAIEAAKRRVSVKPRRCALCEASFVPERSDARYCSAACKQKAFRRRDRPAKLNL
jgi:hypothetical protein